MLRSSKKQASEYKKTWRINTSAALAKPNATSAKALFDEAHKNNCGEG